MGLHVCCHYRKFPQVFQHRRNRDGVAVNFFRDRFPAVPKNIAANFRCDSGLLQAVAKGLSE
jgi:hypothetical protein